MAAPVDVGTANMKLTLDVTDYSVAIERAEAKQKGLGAVAEQEAAKMSRAQRDVIRSLDNQISKYGLTRDQVLAYNIATRTSGEVQTALLAKLKATTAEIDKQGVAVHKGAIEFNQYGLSAKQQTAALRQVPAQLTDIFVSLAGGQNPMMVLIQQGGQLRDVFGGLAPAANALGGALAKLVNPWTLLAAAAAGIAAGAIAGEAETNAFAQSLALTGRISGQTVSDLRALQIEMATGITTEYEAARALTEVAKSGKFVGEQFGIVTEAAITMERATDQSVEKTVEQFAKLADDPTKAVAKLNSETHFLTEEIYRQIKALQEQGDTQGAATLAMSAYSDEVQRRAAQVEENLGTLQTAWRNLATGAKAAWDAMMDVGRSDTLTDQIQSSSERINALQSGSGFWHLSKDQVQAEIVKEKANLQGLLSQQRESWRSAEKEQGEQRINDFLINQDQEILARKSADEKRTAEITRSRAESDKRIAEAMRLGMTTQADQIRKNQAAYEAALNAQMTKKGNKTGIANAESSMQLQAIRNQEALTRDAISNTTKLLQANYAARNVTVSEFYAQQRDLVQQDIKAQEDSLLKQIEYLKSRDVAGKDSINVTKQIGELETKLAKVRSDGATALVILGVQEDDVADKRARAIDSYRTALDRSNEAAQRSADAAVRRITVGAELAAQEQRIAEIIADGAEKERELSREFAETNDKDLYNEKLQALREYIDEQVRIADAGYAHMKEAQSSWLNGLTSGINDWTSQASDVAGQVNAITQKSLDKTVDAITDAAMTGKLEWRGLLGDIGKEIAKFMMKKAILQFIQFIGSMWGGSYTNTGSNTGMTDYSGGFGATYAAKGGAFPASGNLSDFSGTIVNKPTPFYFANGAGIMGEAGAEGIFPLERDSRGKLGVKAIGSGGVGGGDVNVSITVNVESNGTSSSDSKTAGERSASYKQFAESMANIAKQEITKARLPGGQLWRVGVG